jgi:hypothetical protein
MAVPGTPVTAAASSTTPSPPEAPNLKKYPMSNLPAHTDWFLCLTVHAREDATEYKNFSV